MTVRIDKDLALRTVPGAGLDSLVGQRASLDVAAGSLITAESVTAENIPSEGHSLVGVAVSTGMLPGVELVSGDEVQVVTTQDPLTATDGGSGDTGDDARRRGVRADRGTGKQRHPDGGDGAGADRGRAAAGSGLRHGHGRDRPGLTGQVKS